MKPKSPTEIAASVLLKYECAGCVGVFDSPCAKWIAGDPLALTNGTGEDNDVHPYCAACALACAERAWLAGSAADGEEARIRELEAEGLDRSDAQSAYDAEQMAKRRV